MSADREHPLKYQARHAIAVMQEANTRSTRVYLSLTSANRRRRNGTVGTTGTPNTTLQQQTKAVTSHKLDEAVLRVHFRRQ